ncbi:MAG: ATP-binding protein, partial [Planctomycetota bacterium]
LRERAAQAGMTLVVEKVEAPDRCLNLDPSVVLQILFNLVDNACKYAAAAQDKRVHIETGQARGLAVIKVRDHGPGVSREFRAGRRPRPCPLKAACAEDGRRPRARGTRRGRGVLRVDLAACRRGRLRNPRNGISERPRQTILA